MLVGVVDVLDPQGNSVKQIGHNHINSFGDYSLLVKETAVWSGGYKGIYRVPLEAFEPYSLGNSPEYSGKVYEVQEERKKQLQEFYEQLERKLEQPQ